MGVEIWVHFEVWERKRRLCWVVSFAEKGLLSEGVLDHDVRIVIDEIGSFCECFAVLCWWLLSDSVLILLWMGMQCGCFVMWYGVDFTRFGGNDHHFEFPPFWLNFHHFTCSSSLFPCLHSDNTLSNTVEWVLWWMGSRCVAQRGIRYLSVVSWTCFEELRCLFVRKGWSTYYSLWRQFYT